MILPLSGAVVVLTGFVSYRLTGFLSVKMNQLGMNGHDVHKQNTPLVAEMGGSAVLLAMLLGAGIIFVFVASDVTTLFLAGFGVILITGLIGVVDDIYSIKQRYKPLLIAGASVLLAVGLTNRSGIAFPFMGTIQLGILYALVAVPLAVVASSNFSNMLAGFNGLEAGCATIAIGTLSALSAYTGHWDAALLGLLLLAGYIGFLVHNWYPARIFPGDTGTLMAGAAIAVIGIMARLEVAAIILSIPAAMDFTLKMWSKRPFSGRSVHGNSSVKDDGTLEPARYPALLHVFMKAAPLTEKQLVVAVLTMEGVYALLATATVLI